MSVVYLALFRFHLLAAFFIEQTRSSSHRKHLSKLIRIPVLLCHSVGDELSNAIIPKRSQRLIDLFPGRAVELRKSGLDVVREKCR